MRRFLVTLTTASACCIPSLVPAQDRSVAANISAGTVHVAELGLPADAAHELEVARQAKDYRGEEAVLLTELARDLPGDRKASLLQYLGGVYFSAGDYMQAAIAWKKADAIIPLGAPLRFTLSMSYIKLGHPLWAREELIKLSAREPQNALFPYWLGRLDYDAQAYDDAILEFRKTIELDPDMSRAHDNLGLCYFYLNQNTAAEAEFRKAISLETSPTPASAWPHLNLGILLEFQGFSSQAAGEVKKAVHLDPKLPQAQFELGKILESEDRLPEAEASYRDAAQLDPHYAEPHVALARVLRREGREADATREVAIYKVLHAENLGGRPAQTGLPQTADQNSKRPAN